MDLACPPEYDGTDIARPKKQALRAWRRQMQRVFQNPLFVAEPAPHCRKTSSPNRSRILSALAGGNAKLLPQIFSKFSKKVGMSPATLHRIPSELLGGQLLGIARALAIHYHR